MSSLRKTLVGAAMAAALVGGTVATPAVAGDNNSNAHKYGKDSYSNRHHDRDDCEYSKKYDVWYDTDHGVKDWKHHGKHGKDVWKCDDDGRWDRHDDKYDDRKRDRHDDRRHHDDKHHDGRGDRWDHHHDNDKDDRYKGDRHKDGDHKGDRYNDKDGKHKGDYRKDGNHRDYSHKVGHDRH
jgi:uncharacterized membrane protein